MKNRIKTRLISVFLLLVFVIPLCGCGGYSAEEQADICRAFSSLGYNDQYVFYETGNIHVGERVIDMSEVDCEGEYCNIILCEGEGAYGYYLTENGTVGKCNIVYVDYETATPEPISSVLIFDYCPHCFVRVCYYRGVIYLRTRCSRHKDTCEYYVCDLSTRIFEEVEDAEAIEQIDANMEKASMEDLGRSLFYDIEYYNPIEEDMEQNEIPPYLYGQTILYELYVGQKLPRYRITDKTTGEVKYVESRDFLKWAKGKIPHLTNMHTSDWMCAYEKGGDIYLLGGITLDFLGYPCYIYIMKYDFDTEQLSYYTSFYMEEWPEGSCALYIP